MNIKILDSWLREHLKTKASPQKIAEVLSLTSVSVERMEKIGNDAVYDIEVTTNRPDLMSVLGLARETATALPQFNIPATFIPLQTRLEKQKITTAFPITVKNNPQLVYRICAVVLDVTMKDSPDFIKQRLEASGIRSLNNLIDITNYVMREVGHPTHVFDFDRLNTKMLVIREAKKGEKIITLDKKEHVLLGGDIVADNGKGEIVDLLGVMGTANSVVTSATKRILFFVDNNNIDSIRKTSMSLGIRSEAAVLNEKNVDPELAMQALRRGIELYKEIAEGKITSSILDIYPQKIKSQTIIVTKQKIDALLGVSVPLNSAGEILTALGFKTTIKYATIQALVPSWRAAEVLIEEDLVEEIARVYGYHRLPSIVPPLNSPAYYHMGTDIFYWERRIKDALKMWGYTEVYTNSLVSETLLEGPIEGALELANPLNEDLVYLRRTLVPSLLQVIRENKTRNSIHIFEIANVYEKKENGLPIETPMLAGIIKKDNASFYTVKGLINQLFFDLGIKEVGWKQKQDGGEGAEVFICNESIGMAEVLQEDIIDFELNFAKILKHVTLKKIYKPRAIYPTIIEDVRIIANSSVSYEDVVATITKQSPLVVDVALLDTFENKKTFRITYQDPHKTLTDVEVGKIREKIYSILEKTLGAKIA